MYGACIVLLVAGQAQQQHSGTGYMEGMVLVRHSGKAGGVHVDWPVCGWWPGTDVMRRGAMRARPAPGPARVYAAAPTALLTDTMHCVLPCTASACRGGPPAAGAKRLVCGVGGQGRAPCAP